MSPNFEYDITRDEEMQLQASPQLLAAANATNRQIVTVAVSDLDSKERFVMFLALFSTIPRVGEAISLERDEVAIVERVFYQLERIDFDGRKISNYAPYITCVYKDLDA